MTHSETHNDVVEVDVLDVSDFRSAAGTSQRVADEMTARAAAGYRTALLHLDDPLHAAVMPFVSAIRRCIDGGLARLVLPHQRVRASIVVVRPPALLQHTTVELAGVQAEQLVVVADAAPRDVNGREPYRVDAVRAAGLRHFGAEPRWAPAGPAIRDAIAADLSEQELLDVDWPGGDEAHVRRIGELIGPPSGTHQGASTTTMRGAASMTTTPSMPRSSGDAASAWALMVSSNGTGMGHLTRLLAYALRAPEGLRPYFVSLSQAVPLVARFGFPYEYVPSVTPTGLERDRWQEYFRIRVSEVVGRLRPAVVVFDGAWPYRGIENVREDHPHVPWVWSRRGMWYRGMNRDQLAKAAWFELVIEPGDFASAADPGATADAPATRVGPVTLLDRDDLHDRAAARSALGLDADAPMALVTLGAGNINDATSTTRIVIDAVRALGLRICVTRAEIAERGGVLDPDVDVVSAYPLSQHYHAFDVAVSAAGYNSFHELLRFGVPTLFLPNVETSLDDQQARARYAADQGWAHSLDKAEPDTVRKLLGDLLENGAAMVNGIQAVDPGNGAGPAMSAVAELAWRR